MSAILAVTLPFFALVLCGWAAARLRILPLAAIPGLNAFTLFFALPALLFRLGAGGALAQGFRLEGLAAYGLAALALVALVWRLERPRHGRLDGAFAALTTAFPNSGFMGLPLLIGLLGPGAAGPIASTLIVDVFLTSSLCLALAHAGEHRSHPLQAARAALRPVLSNPLPWAIALGAAAALFDLQPAGPLDAFLKMLGDAASPVALFSLGAMLERARVLGPQSLEPRAAPHTNPPGVAVLTAIKLVLHPALVAGLGWAATALGGTLPREAWVALVLTAALPSAGNVSLLAERHGADTGRVARLIVASTAASFASFTLLAGWLLAR